MKLGLLTLSLLLFSSVKAEFGPGYNADYNYYGCFLDDDISKGFQLTLQSQSVTYEACQFYCQQTNSQYFFIKDDSSCYCGSPDWISPNGKVKDARCSSECSLYVDQECGRLIYYVGSSNDDGSKTFQGDNLNSNAQVEEDSQYLGCFQDQDVANFNFVWQSDVMTNDLCNNYCQQNYSDYFLILNESACLCSGGNWESKYESADDCSVDCNSDEAICGNKVFTVDYDDERNQPQPDSSINRYDSISSDGDFEYFGCFKTVAIKSFKFTMRSSFLTYRECQDHCQKTNNKYFSIKNGDSCYCGSDQWDVNEGLIENSKCSSKCFEEDQTPKSNCGSSVFVIKDDENSKVLPWSNQLSFGYIANFQYYGCYSNDDVRTFQFALQSKDMNLDACQALCIQNNHVYFYIRDESDCVCGSIDWDSNEENELQDSLCSDECYRSDDDSEVCGNSIYSVNNYYQNRQYESRNDDDFQYYGCYMSLSIKSFKYAMKAESMTHQKCQDYCVQNQYSYFYIKDESSCYCENSKWPSQFGKMIDSQCSEECYENKEEFCGDSVYYIKNSDQNIVYAQATEDGVLQSYGCYLTEDIKDFKFAMQSSQKITYEACQSYCVQNSYGYFYVQKESACYCGASNWVSKSGSVTGTQCAPDCTTKSSKPCGTQVFLSKEYSGKDSLSNEDIEVEFDYNGCYLDKDVENFKLTLKTDYITFTFCENHCRQQNYQYFYIAGGNSCNCGDSNWGPKYGKVQDSKCSTECYANSNEVCGNPVYTVGNDNNQTSNGNEFTIGLKTELVLHGCYLDQDTENFKFSMKSQELSYQQCQRYCQENNFRYFYVEDMTACHCGASNWVAKYGKVHKDRCSSECYGRFDQQCGNFVYYVESYENVNTVNSYGNWSYYGCYENEDMNKFPFGFKQQSMSYQSCQSYCYQKQYNYCYVQADDCFCGSSSIWQSQNGKLEDSSCSSECYETNTKKGEVCGRRVYSWSGSMNRKYEETSQYSNVQNWFNNNPSQNSWGENLMNSNKAWSGNNQIWNARGSVNQYDMNRNVWGNYDPQSWINNNQNNWSNNQNSWSNNQNNWSNKQTNQNGWNNKQNKWNNNQNSWNNNQNRWGNNQQNWSNNQNGWNNNRNSWNTNQNSWNNNRNRWNNDQNSWNTNQNSWNNNQNSWNNNQNSWNNNQNSWNNNRNGWNNNQNSWNTNQNNWNNNQNRWGNNRQNWSNNQNGWNNNRNGWNNNQNGWNNNRSGWNNNQNGWNNNQNGWTNNQNEWNNNRNRWNNKQNGWGNNNKNTWNSWSKYQSKQSFGGDSQREFYYGCYLDQDVNSFKLVLKQNDMSYEKCNEICVQHSYYYYVQDQSSCFCGSSNWVSKFGKVQDSRCSSKCEDNSAQKECGNKVYTTKVSNQPMRWSNNQNNFPKNYNDKQNNYNFWNTNNNNNEQQNSEWKQQNNNNNNREYSSEKNAENSFDLNFLQPFMDQIFKSLGSDADSQNDKNPFMNQLLNVFSNFAKEDDQNEPSESQNSKEQYRGEYSMWKKRGSCEGQCFSRGKQEYTRYCIGGGNCDPAVKTTKYASCIVTKGC